MNLPICLLCGQASYPVLPLMSLCLLIKDTTDTTVLFNNLLCFSAIQVCISQAQGHSKKHHPVHLILNTPQKPWCSMGFTHMWCLMCSIAENVTTVSESVSRTVPTPGQGTISQYFIIQDRIFEMPRKTLEHIKIHVHMEGFLKSWGKRVTSIG